MKQRKWLQLVILFMLTTLLLDACTFSIEVLPTAASSPPTFTPVPLTSTPVLPTTLPASATPTLIPIRDGTVSMLEVFQTFELGEVIRDLAFTPDGTVLAAAGGNAQDFSIRLWDVLNGQAIGTLDGHTDIVWGVAFSPDGKLLASVSSDKTAKIWDWRNRTLLKSLSFPGQVVSVKFSPDGQSLAVGGVDEVYNQIQHAAIWTYAIGSWEPLVKFPEYINIGAMAFSPRGGTLIGGGTSRNVRVWNASDGSSVFTLNHAHQVSQAAISPDGSTVATATCENVMNADCTEGSVWLWNLPTGRLIQRLTGFPDVVEHVAFSADNSSLLAASPSGVIRFYTTNNYQPQFELVCPDGISALVLSPDGGLLATGNANGKVSIWKNVYHP